jgi:hypothetical protein
VQFAGADGLNDKLRPGTHTIEITNSITGTTIQTTIVVQPR